MAIVKRMEYKIIITKLRVKRYAGIAWVFAFITTALFFASAVAGIRYEVLLFLDGIFGLGWLTGISIMVNFYRKLYLELRKLKRCQTSQVSVLVKARIERKIAHAVCLLTVTVFIATFPLLIVVTAALFLPFFRRFTVFRQAEVFRHINSLVNPVLYFHKNKRYKKICCLAVSIFNNQENSIQKVTWDVLPRGISVPFRPLVLKSLQSTKMPYLLDAHFLVRNGYIDVKTQG